jgi:hypothetical protein
LTVLRSVVALALVAGAACRSEEPPELPPTLELSFLADCNLAPGSETEPDGLGGISAVAYSRETRSWLAVSDARVASRFFELDVAFGDGDLRVSPRAVLPFLDEDGEGFSEDELDPEGMVAAPWGSLLVATEVDSRDEPVVQAKLLEFDRKGALVRAFEVPEKFHVSGWPPVSGPRHNLAFEGLALSPDETTLFVGLEGPLIQDGPPPDFENAAFARILLYRVDGRELTPGAEYVYPLGPFSRETDFGEQEVSGGLVEIVALSNVRLLALERIFIRELAEGGRDVTRVRIYDVELSSATDVSALASLASDASWRPATKELRLDLDDVVPLLSGEYRKLDNIEAMGIGAELDAAGRMLLLASDDNFRETQRTQFLLFRLKGV